MCLAEEVRHSYKQSEEVFWAIDRGWRERAALHYALKL